MSVTSVYVDASVIAGLVLRDLPAGVVLEAIGPDTILVFSRFGLGEAVSATAARIRATRGTDADADAKVAALRHFLVDWHEDRFDPADLDRAIVLTARASSALKFPDAIHVAIAERLGVPLLTGDRQQNRAARNLGLSTILVAMKEQ